MAAQPTLRPIPPSEVQRMRLVLQQMEWEMLRRRDQGPDAVEAEARKIQRALARIDHGTYGLCSACHSPIPLGSLKASPTLAECPGCQTQAVDAGAAG